MKFKLFLSDKDYNYYKTLKEETFFLNIRKRSILLNSHNITNDFYAVEELENNYIEKIDKITTKVKTNIFNNIFFKKKDKHKKNFISYNSILQEDLLAIIYDYYNESNSVIAIKLKNNESYFLTTNNFLMKNIFLNNRIDKVYKINIVKLNNNSSLPIDFFEFYSKNIYNEDREKYSDCTKIINNNDFYSPIICIKIYYYYRIKKIKNKVFYINNYNNLFLISNFFKDKKKLANYKLFYMNKISYNNNKNIIPISYKEMKKYNIFRQINEYMIKIIKNNIVQ